MNEFKYFDPIHIKYTTMDLKVLGFAVTSLKPKMFSCSWFSVSSSN